MLVELDKFAIDLKLHTTITQQEQLQLTNERGANARDQDWIRATFGGTWPEEARDGWNWFARDAKQRTLGFCTYEQREQKFWWLEEWLGQLDVGFFGPMGVDPRARNKKIGFILAQRALMSLKERGFGRAIIGAVGPVEFYERCCGAVVIQRLERR